MKIPDSQLCTVHMCQPINYDRVKHHDNHIKLMSQGNGYCVERKVIEYPEVFLTIVLLFVDTTNGVAAEITTPYFSLHWNPPFRFAWTLLPRFLLTSTNETPSPASASFSHTIYPKSMIALLFECHLL